MGINMKDNLILEIHQVMGHLNIKMGIYSLAKYYYSHLLKDLCSIWMRLIMGSLIEDCKKAKGFIGSVMEIYMMDSGLMGLCMDEGCILIQMEVNFLANF